MQDFSSDPITLSEAWSMGLSFSPHEGQEDAPALQMARYVWSRLTLPFGDLEGYKPEFFQTLRAQHAALSMAAHTADIQKVKDALSVMSKEIGAVKFSDEMAASNSALKMVVEANLASADSADQDYQAPYIPPLEPHLLEEAVWFRASVEAHGFSKISLSPFAITPQCFKLSGEIQRIAKTFGISSDTFGLNGDIGFVFAPCSSPDKRGYVTYGSYAKRSRTISLFSDNSHTQDFSKVSFVFAHEWMHALEDIVDHRKWLSPVREPIRQARRLFGTMAQDQLEARRLTNTIMDSAIATISSDVLHFIENRASEAVRDQAIHDGKLSSRFMQDVITKIMTPRNPERREQVFEGLMSSFLAADQPPVNREAIAEILMVLDPHIAAFQAISAGSNLFKTNARYLDHKDGRTIFSYWAKPGEMLARAFEVFLLPTAPTPDFLEGSERDQVFDALVKIGRSLSASMSTTRHPSRKMCA